MVHYFIIKSHLKTEKLSVKFGKKSGKKDMDKSRIKKEEIVFWEEKELMVDPACCVKIWLIAGVAFVQRVKGGETGIICRHSNSVLWPSTV